MRSMLNHDAYIKVLMWYIENIKKFDWNYPSKAEIEFHKWLYESWGVRFVGWGEHMYIKFKSDKHKTMFWLKWS